MTNPVDFLNISEIVPHSKDITLTNSSFGAWSILISGSQLASNNDGGVGCNAMTTAVTIQNRRDSDATFSMRVYDGSAHRVMFNRTRIGGNSVLQILDKHTPVVIVRDSPGQGANSTGIEQIQFKSDSAVNDHLTATVQYFLFDSGT
mgnify:CR=1 FL=1